MTETTDPQPLRIPIGHSIAYAVRDVPEIADEYNAEGTIAPTEITLSYRAASDSQFGRVSAYVKGWWMQDGARVPMDKPVGRWLYNGPDGWPAWLAAEARLHDPDAAKLPAPADRAAILREAADEVARWYVDTEREQRMRDAIAHRLRRMAGEAQQPETQAADRAAIIAEILPTWEAVYEPGNVSDYLIGYANDEAPAKAAAEAWMRSQAEVTGRLEWVPEERLATGRYDQWFELIERHDGGIDTGPGLIVRRRVADEARAGAGERR